MIIDPDPLDTWEGFLRRIALYVYSRTPEELAQLDKELGIEKYVTPFGILRIRRPRFFGENT